MLEAHAAAILYGTDVYIAQCVVESSSVSDNVLKFCCNELWKIKICNWDEIPDDATIVMHTAGNHYVRVVPLVKPNAKPTASPGIIFQQAMQHVNEQHSSASSSDISSDISSGSSGSSSSSSSSSNGGSSGSSSSRKRPGDAVPRGRQSRTRRASGKSKKNKEDWLRQKVLENYNDFIQTQREDTSSPPALGSFILRMFALFSSYSCVRNGTATRCTRTYNKPARHPRNAGRNRKVIITIHINIFSFTLCCQITGSL